MKSIYFVLSILLFNIVNVNAHSFFNSDTRVIGGYKIQIATDPEIPSEGENTKLMVAVTDSNDGDLHEVILSLRLLQGDEVVLAFGPTMVMNGHLVLDHIFNKPGQYIAEINIYEDGKIIDAKFNIGVTRTVSMIFISLIIISMFIPIAVVVAIKFLKRKNGLD